jgi:hypothetical protein
MKIMKKKKIRIGINKSKSIKISKFIVKFKKVKDK